MNLIPSPEASYGLIGVVLGFALSYGVEQLRRRRENRAHRAALKAEVDFIGSLAATFLSDGVMSPTYRCPTVGYANAFPALLRAGQMSQRDADALLRFYSEAETWNRVLDFTAAAIASIPAGHSAEVPGPYRDGVEKEYRRSILKAQRLVKPNGELFREVMDVLNIHG